MQKINFFKNKNYQFYLIISAIFLTALIGFSGLVVKYNKDQQTDIKQEAINISKNTINHIRKDKDQLKQELKALKTQYQQKQEEIDNINHHLQTKQNDLTTNINEKKQLQQQLNKALIEKGDLDTLIKHKNTDLDDLNNSVNQLTSDITNLNTSINNLNTEINNNQIIIQEKETIIKELNTETKNIKDDIKHKENKIDDLKKDLSQEQTNNKNQTQKIKDLEQQINNLNQEIQTKKETLEDKNKENQNHQQEISTLKTKIETLEQQNKNYHNQITSLNQKIKDHEAEKKQLKEEINNLKDKNKQTQDNLTNAKNQLEQQIKVLKNDIKNQEEQKKQLNKDIENKKATIKNITDDKDMLKTEKDNKINDLKGIISSLNSQISSLSSSIYTLNNKVTQLTNDLTTKNNKISSLESQINNLYNSLNSSNTRISTLNNEISSLRSQLNNVNNDNSSLRNQINDKNNEINRLKQQNNNSTDKEVTKYEIIPYALKNVISLIDDKPYTKYLDKEGNTIREYRFFKNLKPVAKDIHGRYNFFSKEDFNKEAAKLDNMYPIMFTEGKHDLLTFILDKNNKIIKKYDFSISKSNYQLIYTNKPDNTTELLTKDIKGDNGFYNQSVCSLNTIKNIDICNYESIHVNLDNIIKNNNYPYMRFMTKNLKIKFDYMKLINKFIEIINNDFFSISFYKNFKYLNIRYDTYKTHLYYCIYNNDLKGIYRVIGKLLKDHVMIINRLNDINNKLPNNLKFSYLVKEFDPKKEYLNIFKDIDIKPFEYIDNISFNKQAWAEHLKTLNINKDDKDYDLRINLIYNLTKEIYDPANKYKISDGSTISIFYTSTQKQQNKNSLPTLEQ